MHGKKAFSVYAVKMQALLAIPKSAMKSLKTNNKEAAALAGGLMGNLYGVCKVSQKRGEIVLVPEKHL